METLETRPAISLDYREAAVVLGDPRIAEDGYGVWYDLKAALRIANFDTSRVGLEDLTLTPINQDGFDGYMLSYTTMGRFQEYSGSWYRATQFLIDGNGTIMGVAQAALNTRKDRDMSGQRMTKVRELAERAIWQTRKGNSNERKRRDIDSGIEDSPIMLQAASLDLTQPKTFPVVTVDRAEPNPENVRIPKAENVTRMISAIESGQTKADWGYWGAVFKHRLVALLSGYRKG